MHQTKQVKEWSKRKKIHLLFNAPNSSKINLAEYVFEIIKRPFRRRITKDWNENLGKELHKESLKLENSDFHTCWRRTRRWL